MEALRTKGVVKDGILTVHVPEKFEGKDIEIIVLSTDENDNTLLQEDLRSEKIERLLKITGTAKSDDIMKYYGTANYPEIDLEKFNVYEQ